MDPDRARYLAAVEARYVTLRGRGFALSARDVVRVERWRTGGIPLAGALRVLEDGVRDFRRAWRRGEGAPRTLAYFERALDDAMAQRAARLVGASDATADPPPDPDGAGAAPDPGAPDPRFDHLLAAVEAAGQPLPDGPLRELLRQTWRRLRFGRDAGEDLWALTADLDRVIVAELAALVPPETRDALAHDADLAVARAGGARMSAEARREHHRFELEARIREAYGVPELLEVLLEPQAL